MTKTSSEKREELIAKIQEFCLFDDDFMSKVFEDDKEATDYVIFITEHDVLGRGLPLYTIERTVQEDGVVFDDKGVNKMCKIMEDLKQEGIKEGHLKGRLSAYIEMIKDGLLTIKDAAQKLGIPEEELQAQLN